jgi:hypothetical protein
LIDMLAPSLMATGLVFGLIHAMDPDHLITISSLAARSDGRASAYRCAASWAMGHGTVVLGAVASALLLGRTIPAGVSTAAEMVVGLILVVAGSMLIYPLIARSAEPLRDPVGPTVALRQKAPFMVGMVHGTAGSAGMLALLPAAALAPLAGLVYALTFSAGTLAGMIGFSLLFDRARSLAVDRLPAALAGLRLALGVVAVGFGAFWLVEAAL